MEEGGSWRREHSQSSGCGLSFGTDSRACARERGACFSCWPCRLSLVLVGYGRTVVRTISATPTSTPVNPPIPCCRRLLSSTYSGTYFYYCPLHPTSSTKACPTKVTDGQPLLPRLVGWTRQGSRLLSYSLYGSPAQRQQLHWVRAHHDGRGNGKTHIVSSCSNVAIGRLACKAQDGQLLRTGIQALTCMSHHAIQGLFALSLPSGLSGLSIPSYFTHFTRVHIS